MEKPNTYFRPTHVEQNKPYQQHEQEGRKGLDALTQKAHQNMKRTPLSKKPYNIETTCNNTYDG